jgi:hypothetical protein
LCKTAVFDESAELISERHRHLFPPIAAGSFDFPFSMDFYLSGKLGLGASILEGLSLSNKVLQA